MAPTALSVPPYDRITIRPDNEDESVALAEVQDYDFYYAIVETVGAESEANFSGAFFESEVKIFLELCATHPGAAIRVYDKKLEEKYMIDFSLHDFEDVTAEVFDLKTADRALPASHNRSQGNAVQSRFAPVLQTHPHKDR
jgi:hypothetical protein